MTQPPYPPGQPGYPGQPGQQGQPGQPGSFPRYGAQDDVPGQRPQDRPQDTPRPESPWASPGGQQNLPVDLGQANQPSAPNYPANPVQPGQPGYPGQPGGSSYPAQSAYGPYQQAYGYGYPAAGGRTNGLATASLVVSLAGLVFTLAAPVGLGLGIAALRKIRQTGEEGRGLAMAGAIIGGVITGFMVLGILFILILVIAGGGFASTT